MGWQAGSLAGRARREGHQARTAPGLVPLPVLAKSRREVTAVRISLPTRPAEGRRGSPEYGP